MMVNYKNDELNQLASLHHWIDETDWIRQIHAVLRVQSVKKWFNVKFWSIHDGQL